MIGPHVLSGIHLFPSLRAQPRITFDKIVAKTTATLGDLGYDQNPQLVGPKPVTSKPTQDWCLSVGLPVDEDNEGRSGSSRTGQKAKGQEIVCDFYSLDFTWL